MRNLSHIKKVTFFLIFMGSLFILDSCKDNKQADGKVESSITRDTIDANQLVTHGQSLTESQRDSSIILYKKALDLVHEFPAKKFSILIQLSECYHEPFDSLSFFYAYEALKIADSIKDNKSLALAYYSIGWAEFIIDDLKNGLKNLELSKKICQKYSFKSLEGRCLDMEGQIYIYLGDYDKAINFGRQGLEVVKQLKDSAKIAFFNARIGFAYSVKGEYDQALMYFFSSVDFIRFISSKQTQSWIYSTIGDCYLRIGEPNLAFIYFTKASDINENTSIKSSQFHVMVGLSDVYSLQKKFEKAKELTNKAIGIAKDINDNTNIANAYLQLGLIQVNMNELNEALLSFTIAFNYCNSSDNAYYKRHALVNIAEVYSKMGEYHKSIEFAKRSIDDNLDIQKQSYYYLSLSYDSLKNTKEAFRYYKLYTQAKDSILNIEKSKQIKQMEARYQAEQKQQQIELQQTQLTNKDLQLRRQRLTMALIFSVFVLLSLIGITAMYFLRRRRKQELLISLKNEELSKEKYQNLFKESQMQAIKEKITGQEEERSRIARELHDGIGGTLAAVKMQLEEVNHKSNPEDMANLVNMVANTWEEVRTISHNLMPPQFTEVSVDQVLQNHIKGLSKSGKIYFTVQFIPQTGWDKVSVELQVETYRIVQELCSNIIKYSKATTVEIQLSRFEDSISLTIEDNGNPFTYSGNGIGYRNLQERLKIYDGSFEKSTEDNKGNTYLVQIPLARIKP